MNKRKEIQSHYSRYNLFSVSINKDAKKTSKSPMN